MEPRKRVNASSRAPCARVRRRRRSRAREMGATKSAHGFPRAVDARSPRRRLLRRSACFHAVRTGRYSLESQTKNDLQAGKQCRVDSPRGAS